MKFKAEIDNLNINLRSVNSNMTDFFDGPGASRGNPIVDHGKSSAIFVDTFLPKLTVHDAPTHGFFAISFCPIVDAVYISPSEAQPAMMNVIFGGIVGHDLPVGRVDRVEVGL